MDNLLASVLTAHGGLQNWSTVTKITAQLSLGGPFWAARGWPDIYSDQTVTIDPHREHITFAPFTGSGRMSMLDVDPERVAILTQDGRLIEERADPRKSFPVKFDGGSTPWDAIQVANAFTSAAMWNYLTAPFIFADSRIVASEIEPWIEAAETWRRLAVTFPKSVANHNAHQVFYYDKAFMLRRMDYSPDVTGSPPIAHYTHYKTFDGFLFPTRRLVHLHDAEGVIITILTNHD